MNKLYSFFASVCVLAVSISVAKAATPDLFVGSAYSDSILRYDGSTGTSLGTFASGGGLEMPLGFDFGSDGNLYVSGFHSNTIACYNGATGQFIRDFPSQSPHGLAFGPDESLYVVTHDPQVATQSFVSQYDASTGSLLNTFDLAPCGLEGAHSIAVRGDYLYISFTDSAIARFDTTTGSFENYFVSPHSGELLDAQGFEWGPDGNLYVASNNNERILRYDGDTGDFMDEFVPEASGGLYGPRDVAFGPDGNLYVTSSATNEILRYDGTTGAFLDSFVPAGSGGLNSPWYLCFAVPEPSTLLILIVGGTLLVCRPD